jgi:hypothetical protein
MYRSGITDVDTLQGRVPSRQSAASCGTTTVVVPKLGGTTTVVALDAGGLLLQPQSITPRINKLDTAAPMTI